MKAFFRLIRLQNLLIVAITLLLLHFFTNAPLKPVLFVVLLLGTLLIAAAGNVINDIFDIEIDQINKPESMILGSNFSIAQAWFFYLLMNGIALLLVLFLGNEILTAFFSSAIFLLYFYSKTWKGLPLIGNLVVALLCAWVVFEYWYLAKTNLPAYWSQMLLLYAGFAFFTTLCRELVKDLEDQKGDAAMGAQTLPVRYGQQVAVFVTVCALFILLIILFYQAFALLGIENYWALGYLCICLILPLIWFLFKLYRVEEGQVKSYFSKLSRKLKVYMLLGLGLLCFL